jgi:hypothetical protein
MLIEDILAEVDKALIDCNVDVVTKALSSIDTACRYQYYVFQKRRAYKQYRKSIRFVKRINPTNFTMEFVKVGDESLLAQYNELESLLNVTTPCNICHACLGIQKSNKKFSYRRR